MPMQPEATAPDDDANADNEDVVPDNEEMVPGMGAQQFHNAHFNKWADEGGIDKIDWNAVEHFVQNHKANVASKKK